MDAGEDLRPLGHIEEVRNHEVHFYDDDKTLIDRISVFAGGALGAGEACIVCATPSHRSALVARLELAGLNVTRLVEDGRFVLLDAAGTLKQILVNGWPDVGQLTRLTAALLAPFDQNGRRISVFGEMVALLWEQKKTDAAICLEKMWSELGTKRPLSILCAYPIQDGAVTGNEFRRICDVHSDISTCASYFQSSEQSNKLTTIAELQHKAQILQVVLEEREQLASALSEEVEELRKMHELSLQVSSMEPLQIMHQVIKAVAGFHHTNFAAFSLCDTSQNSLNVVASLGFNDAFFAYMKGAPAMGRPCRTCMDRRVRVVMEDTEADPDFHTHLAASRAAGFRSAHCTPLLNRSGELLAILSVYFPEPRKITTRERRLTDLYAQIAATAIENAQLLQETTSELERRKTAEDALTKSEEFSRSIIESSVDCIAVLNTEGNVIYMSGPGQRAMGIPNVESVLPRSWSSLWNSDDQNRAVEAVSAALAGQVAHFEGSLQNAGETTSWDVNLAPMFNKNDKIEALTAVARNMTAIRMAHAALMQSEKLAAAGRLAATVAHEINNPLEAVTNFLYLVKTTEGLPEHVYGFLEAADQELARVGHIARQTLGFYRDTSQPEMIEIHALMDDILAVYQRKLQYKQLVLDCRVKEQLSFFARKGDLKQVLSNLLANAIDATPNHGRILLRAHSSYDWRSGQAGLRIIVADNGAGMSAETKAKAFSAFFTTKKEVGTGIGLWVTRNILMNHGGTIRCHSSQGVHSGTVMNIFLPTL